MVVASQKVALSNGLHAYCEKPLTHAVGEARTLAELAAKKKLVTQMGTQIHAGDNYRRVVEVVQAGLLGTVSRVQVWLAGKLGGDKMAVLGDEYRRRGHEPQSTAQLH